MQEKIYLQVSSRTKYRTVTELHANCQQDQSKSNAVSSFCVAMVYDIDMRKLKILNNSRYRRIPSVFRVFFDESPTQKSDQKHVGNKWVSNIRLLQNVTCFFTVSNITRIQLITNYAMAIKSALQQLNVRNIHRQKYQAYYCTLIINYRILHHI